MALLKRLRKKTISVILYNGATTPIDVYYLELSETPGLIGTFTNTITLPTTNGFTGRSLCGYKLTSGGVEIARFKPGQVLGQTCYGYSSTHSTITNSFYQYEDLYNAILQFYPATLQIQAIYQEIPIKLNTTFLDGLKEIKYNGDTLNTLKYEDNYLFTKSNVTIKYVSKVNIAESGWIPWTNTCNLEIASGANNLSIPNYALNKNVLPRLPYTPSIDTYFERKEPNSIKVWKDLVCLPATNDNPRNDILIIPQKSRFIDQVNTTFVYEMDNWYFNLGVDDSMLNFDSVDRTKEIVLERNYSDEKKYMIYTITLDQNRATSLTSGCKIRWFVKSASTNNETVDFLVTAKQGNTTIASYGQELNRNAAVMFDFPLLTGGTELSNPIKITIKHDYGIHANTIRLTVMPFFIIP